MPPRKNVAPSNALRNFFCDICNKGYPRQPDYENHLRSYDHNHRQRLADMKKLTAQNDSSDKKRGPDDMKSMPVDSGEKKMGGALKLKKVGTPVGGAGAGVSRFKKVGVTVPDASKPAGEEASKAVDTGESEEKEEEDEVSRMQKELEESQKDTEEKRKRLEAARAKQASEKTQSPAPAAVPAGLEAKENATVDEDVVMGEAEDGAEEQITWEQYDFTKPTGCDHANCPGCKVDGIWDDDFELIAV